MSAPIKTGGPAFPTENARQTGSNSWHEEGMTLRDYFAAKAMQSLIDASRYSGVIGVNNYEHTLSALAYKVADAMLKAREA